MAQVTSASAPKREEVWKELSEQDQASWYLDPLVADQKRRSNASLLVDSTRRPARSALKTDAFEEAYGEDSPLVDLLPMAARWCVMDGAPGIVQRAEARKPSDSVDFLAADVRYLPLKTAGLDLVFSNSTLDHFESSADFEIAIRELARVLEPEGRLVFTTDNPLNPGYWFLRWLCSTSLAPYPLGFTPGPARLRRILEAAGFEIRSMGYLIHNPRGLSTAIFLALRRLLGKRADGPIRFLLAAFEWTGRLPTRRFTGCYITVDAVRRSS